MSGIGVTASQNGLYCTGDTIALEATLQTGLTYNWTGPGGYIQNNNRTPQRLNATSPMAGTYTVVASNASGCTTSAFTSITVNPSPSPVAAGTGGSTDFCTGQTLSLEGQGPSGANFSWTGPGGWNSFAQNPTRANLDPAHAGAYNLTVTQNGCSSMASVSITVGPSGVSASNTGPYCAGATIELNATGPAGSTYDWSGPNSFAAFGLQNPTIPNATTAMSGTYTVTITSGSCTVTRSTSVGVNAGPVTSISPPASYCVGDNFTVAASGGTTYIWEGPGGFTTNTASFTRNSATTAMSGTYTVTITQSTCVTVLSTTVNVGTLSTTINAAPNVTAVCTGQSISYASSASANSYLWSDGSTTQNITVIGGTPGTYSYQVTITSSSGCTATASRNLTVNAPPSFTLSLTPANGQICSGQPIRVQASGPAGQTYTWNHGIGASADFTQTLLADRTYLGTVTNAAGCTATTSSSITVFSNPSNPLISVTTANGTGVVCPGASATLTDINNSGPSFVWDWSTGGNTPSITVQPPSTTAYSVTVTNLEGCSRSSSVTVTVNSPTVAINASPNLSSVCQGQNLTLQASGGVSYLWADGVTTQTRSVSPTFTTTYSVSATDNNGCVGGANYAVNVFTPPNVAISAPIPSICAGSSTSMTASGASSYNWLTGQGINATVSVSPPVTQTFTVVGTDANGCTASASQVITVNANPITPFISGPTNICPGQNITLTETASGTGVFWNWSTGDNSSSINVAPSATTTYSVTVTNGFGCTATSSRSISVNGVTASISLNTTGTICSGQNVSLSATGGTGYIWSTGQTTANVTVQPTTSLAPPSTEAIVYQVTATGSGCQATGAITVTVNARPQIGISPATAASCTGQSVSLSAFCAGCTSYAWVDDDNNLINTSGLTVLPQASRTYVVTATTAAGCSDTLGRFVAVAPAPSPAIQGALQRCENIPATFTLGIAGGAAPFSYAWVYDSQFGTSASFNFPPVPGLTPLTVVVTDNNGCEGRDTVMVDGIVCAASSLDVLPASVTGVPGEYCPNTLLTLSLSATPPGQVAYLWSTGQTTAFITPTLSSDSVFSLTVTVNGDLFATYNSGLLRVVEGRPVVQSVSRYQLCSATDTSVLSLTTPSGQACPNCTVEIYRNSVLLQTLIGLPNTYTITGPGIYQAASACGWSAPVQIQLNVLQANIAVASPIICQGNTALLSAQGTCSACQYQWSTGENTASITVSMAQNYLVTVTDLTTGCTVSAQQAISVTIPALDTVIYFPISLSQDSVRIDSLIFSIAPNTVSQTALSFSGANFNTPTRMFYPASAGLGTHTLVAANLVAGCERTDTGYITVLPRPQVPGLSAAYCRNSGITSNLLRDPAYAYSNLGGLTAAERNLMTVSYSNYNGQALHYPTAINGNSNAEYYVFDPDLVNVGSSSVVVEVVYRTLFSRFDLGGNLLFSGSYIVGVFRDTIQITPNLSAQISSVGPNLCRDNQFVQIPLYPTGGVFSVEQLNGQGAGTVSVFTPSPSNHPDTAWVFINPSQLHVNETVDVVYRLRYLYSPGGCLSSDSALITIAAPADPGFSLLSGRQQFCVNEGADMLVPNQIGGAFYINGLGVLNPSFDPSALGVGNHDVRYTIGNALGCLSEFRDTFRVNALPNLSMTRLTPLPGSILSGDLSICAYESAFSIRANPQAAAPQGQLRFTTRAAGTQAVSNPFNFNPSTVLAGVPLTDTTLLTYTYTDTLGCTNELVQRLIVSPRPQVSLSGLSSTYCQDPTAIIGIDVQLGPFTRGLGTLGSSPSTGNLNPFAFTYRPANLTNNELVSYQFLDTVTGCRDTIRRNVQVISNAALSAANPRFAPGQDLPLQVCRTGDSIRVITQANLPNAATPPFFNSTRGGLVRQNGDTAWIVPNQMQILGDVDSFRYILSYQYIEQSSGCAASVRDTMDVFLLPNLRLQYANARPLPRRDTICAQPGDSVEIYVYDDRFPSSVNLIPALVNFSGTRVRGNFFFPQDTGLNLVTADYTDFFGCRSVLVDTIRVLPNPRPNITGLMASYCEGFPNQSFIALPAGGTWTFMAENLNGSSGFQSFAPYVNNLSSGQSILIPGGTPLAPTPISSGVLRFGYTVTNPNGCISEGRHTATVFSRPSLSVAPINQILCTNTLPVQLIGEVNGLPDSTGIGLFFEINGSTRSQLLANVFNPNQSSGGRQLRYVFDEPGTGCRDSINYLLEVYTPPSVQVTNLQGLYCEDAQPVLLSDNSQAFATTGLPASLGNQIAQVTYTYTGQAVAFQDFGNGQAEFRPQLAIVGVDTLRVLVEDAVGCQAVLIQPIIVSGLPANVSISLPDTVLCENQVLPLSAVGSPASANSRFRLEDLSGLVLDSFVGFTNVVSILPQNSAYAAVGRYRLIYRYEDPNACASEDSLVFGVHPQPQAAFAQLSYCEGDSIGLESRASFAAYLDARDTVLNWVWSFQGNTLSGNTDSIITLPNQAPGWYSARLELRSGAGCQSLVDSLVFVYRKPNLRLRTEGGCAGDNVLFSADSLGLVPIFNGQALDQISSVVWDFGDGSPLFNDNTSVGGVLLQPLQHTYNAAGLYFASVEVLNNGYCVARDTVSVIVSPRVSVLPQAPYSEGFSQSSAGWFAAATDSLSQWHWGLLQGQNIQAPNNPLWALNNGLPYSPQASAWLYSPCFDLTALSRPMIKLDYFANMYAFDGVVLEVFDTSINPFTNLPRGWISLGRKDEGLGWYNNPSTVFGLLNFKPLDANTSLDAWTGTSSAWQTGRLALDNYRHYNQLRLRFSFGSVDVPNQDNREGFALDNIWLGERQRLVAVEHFSNPNVSSMRNINNRLYSQVLAGPYAQDVVLMEYHSDKSGLDSINLLNPADHNARSFYYGANDAETVINGNAYQGPTTALPLSVLEQEMLRDPAFRIGIQAFNIINNRAEVNAWIQATQPLPLDEYVVHVLLTEDSVFSQGAMQRHVFRKFLPDHNALNLVRSFQAGDSLNYRQTWQIDNSSAYNFLNLRAVVLVQHLRSKQIYQVATHRQFNYFDPTVDVEMLEAEAGHLEQFKLFPNPAKTYIRYSLERPLPRRHRWEVFDLNGRLLLSGLAEAGQTEAEINLPNWPAGFYFFRFSDTEAKHFAQRSFIIRE